MNKKTCSLAVIGGGIGGIAAAVAAYDAGLRDILIIEIGDRLGGVLHQCIHSGFGLHTFGQELTGPEYSARFEKMVEERGIKTLLKSPVMELRPDKTMTVISKMEGVFELEAKAVVIAMGCRERPAGAIGLEGQRPAGVLTAGTAQRYINLEGYMVGRRAVILGSGDIGLIMARRLTLEGAEVVCVCELMPYSNGLNRNIVQCLDDFGIPLRLSTTVIGVEGENRVSGVWVAPVDRQTLKPDIGKKEFVECDTLLLSVGLIPETELAQNAGIGLGSNRGISVDERRQTLIPGIFACGNVVQVHDLVDYVAREGKIAGESAAQYLNGAPTDFEGFLKTQAGNGIGYVVPERISLPAKNVTLNFRVKNVFRNVKLVCSLGNRVIAEKKRSVMVPGEMEKMTVNLENVENDGGVLKIEVVQA